MRTYSETHPWITFTLNTNLFDHRLWMSLGEAASKCHHIAGVPLAPKVASDLQKLYLVKGALATTAIEGNTLSEEEAGRIIEGSLKLPTSQKYLADELNNIVNAVDTLTYRLHAIGPVEQISVKLLKEMNEMVLKGLELGEDVVPGEIRKHSVVVGRYRCAPAQDCEFLLEQFCKVLNDFPSPNGEKSQFCIIKAIFAHLYFVWIHPFGDGNGRTARLLELYILLSAGFPQPTGHLLSNHYNKTRSRYYEKLDAAVHSEREVVNFIKYSVEGLVEGLREQIDYIRRQQWHVAWINYVHERFHMRNSPADARRRRLVLALSEQAAPVPIGSLDKITTGLALEYHDKTPKTLMRDVNALADMQLVVKLSNGTVKANREKILAFSVWRAADEIPEIPKLRIV